MSEIIERTSETVSFNPLLLLLNFFPTFYDKSSKNRIKLKEFYGQHLCVTHLDAVTLSHQAFIALAHLLTIGRSHLPCISQPVAAVRGWGWFSD